jgi:hypothetical protein
VLVRGPQQRRACQSRRKRLFDDRVCGRCGTAFTSQWRSGPAGPSTYADHLTRGHTLWPHSSELHQCLTVCVLLRHDRLCNACGIRYFRLVRRERRRNKTTASATSETSGGEMTVCLYPATSAARPMACCAGTQCVCVTEVSAGDHDSSPPPEPHPAKRGSIQFVLN